MDDFNMQIMHYREQMEKQKQASAQVISTEMDTMKQELENQARGLERREQAELLRKVNEMVASVSKQAECLQKSFLTINEGLDARFTLFEEYVQARLDAITVQVRGKKQTEIISGLEQGFHALRKDVLELQQNMSSGDVKRIVDRFSCIDDATAAALPSLVAGWGSSQFASQKELVEFVEAKLDGISTNSTHLASLDALDALRRIMESKVKSLEDRMSTCDGMLQFVMRQPRGDKGEAATSSPSLQIEELRAEFEDRIEKAIAMIRSEQRAISHDQMARDQSLMDAQADSKKYQEELKRDLEQLVLASARARGKQADSQKYQEELKRGQKQFALASVAETEEDQDDKRMPQGGLEETKDIATPGVSKLILRLGGRAPSEDFSLEALQRELLAVVAEHGDELAKICSRLDDLDSRNRSNAAHICDEEHISALEEGLQYLSERIVAMEKAAQNQPASPQPPARGRPGPRRFSSAEEPGMSQIMSMREEIQRFRGRLVGVEQALEQLSARAVRNAPKDNSADLTDRFDKQLHELYECVQRGSEDCRNQGSNLLKAVRDSQRTSDLTRSKLEDLVGSFSKLNSRFEASVPQLLHLVLELSRRGGGGTGETYGDDLMDEDVAGHRSSVAGAVSAMQDLLYGCADGSGVPFVSPITMREAFAGFEQLMQSQMSKFQGDMIADLCNKADREETSTLSAQLQSAQQRIQVLGQHLFKILSSQDQPDGEGAAVSRVQLCGRCLSCDKAVDLKGRWRGMDWDRFAGGSPRPASPLAREARPLSGLRRHIEQSLPAVDHGRPR
eukprot:TRINITY_DN87368_c0_g1_i1.p1 TRINITY_DN87368_c0_g1~~TRINITY_DN87368_c0_g1_i1.p1  ORF type:complete len:792 (+),score=159.64 TRINITY_DN87368_c0_g1_i1:97-2472(+)